MDEVLKLYEQRWDEETKIFLRYVNLKKEETERVSSLEKEIEIKRSYAGNLSEQSTNNIHSEKLIEIYDALKAREALYETYLQCSLSYESSNVYKFSFLNADSSVAGWIRFKRDVATNKWMAREFQPDNVIPETMIDKFQESQDTQGLLCYFRSHI